MQETVRHDHQLANAAAQQRQQRSDEHRVEVVEAIERGGEQRRREPRRVSLVQPEFGQLELEHVA